MDFSFNIQPIYSYPNDELTNLFNTYDYYDSLENELMNTIDHDVLIETAIQLSLQTQQPVTKRIIDNDVLSKLECIIYDSSYLDTVKNCITCPISLEDFQEGDEIIKLPCLHYFLKLPIYNWLQNESASCPICRYQFKYKELVKLEAIETNDHEIHDHDNIGYEWNQDLDIELLIDSILNELD